jgi:hypothetical protein
MTDEEKTKNNNYFEEGSKLRDEINQRLKQKDYVLTVYQTGEKMMSGGEWERMVSPQRFYKVCSLKEIPDVIKFMKTSFWHHPDLKDGMSERQKNKIPYEEKKWGIYSHIDITPLTKEKEEQFLKDIESGFLQTWRDISSIEN